MFLFITAPEIIAMLIVPIGIFFLGYVLGKKSGYIKRVKESENNNQNGI